MTNARSVPPVLAIALMLTASLATCQGDPRSVDFFVVNEAEAKRLQESCTTDSTRGAKCDNARTALATIAANRMLDYKPAPAAGRP